MFQFSLASSFRTSNRQRLIAALLLCVALCGMQAAGLRHAVAHHAPSWLHSQAEAGLGRMVSAAGDETNAYQVQHYCAALDAVALGAFLHRSAPTLPASLASHRAPLTVAAWGRVHLTPRHFAARAPPVLS